MAFNNSFTAVVGATYTAAQYNTYVRDNFTAIWVGTTAGDMDYYTSATAKSRLAIGANGAIMKSTGSAPAWVAAGGAGSIFYNNGASTPAWLAMAANGYYLESGTVPQWIQFRRYISFLLNKDIALTVGDDAARFRIPNAINGWNIISAAASRKSGTGVPAFQIRNVTDAVDVLSTKITIDSGETDASTAAVPPVINTANDDVATADQFAIDVDVAGTNTLYAFVEIGFAKP